MSSCTLLTCARPFSVPLFLVPAVAGTINASRTTAPRTFSTSPTFASRRVTGPNKQRGVSAIRSKNPKAPTEVYFHPLPQPVIDPARRALFKTRPDHGLWGFFNEKQNPMVSPSSEASHGRAWTPAELGNNKDFSDLHKLYWTCVLEQNRVATRSAEMRRTKAGYGLTESKTRLKTIQITMKNIRRALVLRYQNWQEAQALLHEQPVEALLEPEHSLETLDIGSEDGGVRDIDQPPSR